MEKKVETAPVVVGGVYRKFEGGKVLHGVCVAREEREGGQILGEIRHFGYPNAIVIEGRESMMGWDLIARPVELEEPVCSARKETEVQRLQRRVDELENALPKTRD